MINSKGMKDIEQRFLDLTDKYKRMIYKVCYVYTENHEDVNDLFQDVILNLWKAYPSFRGESKEETWMYRVALNTCISVLRKQSRKPDFIPLNIEAEVLTGSDDENLLAKMYALISKLNKVEKAIILLYLEDKPYDEISAIIGISKTNVGVKLSRIREKLKVMSND